jgi:hypothetical protein
VSYVLSILCTLVLLWCVSFEVRLRKHQILLDPIESLIKFVLFYMRR